jgi:membrane protein DedA with SNARE-associated domain
MVHFQQLLREYLEIHGYWVLFVGTFLEGEAILIMAGFLAFQGYLHPVGVIMTSFAGSFLGDQFYFYLGRMNGRSLMRRFHFIARRFREALRLIEKYGSFVAFISRFTYGLRIILPIILGITSLPSRTFLFINLFSALVWATVFSMAGYLFGKSASLFLEDVGKYEHHLLMALAGIILSFWLAHAWHAWKIKKPARARLARMRALRAARVKEL